MSSAALNDLSYQPVTLSTEEISNPYLVIDYFFDFDGLDGQLELLKKWRDVMLTETTSVSTRNNPSSVLHIHQRCVRLVEGLYLLRNVKTESPLAKKETRKNRVSDQNIVSTILTIAEIQDPALALRQIFDTQSLEFFRSTLYEWLENGLSNHLDPELMPAVDVIALYETMQRLFAIAWLINNHAMNLESTKSQPLNVNDPQVMINGNKNITLYQLNKDIPEDTETLVQLITAMKEKVSGVKAIYFLGSTPRSADRYYFYVITPFTEEPKIQDIRGQLEDACKPIFNTVVLVHSNLHAITGGKKDDKFMSNVVASPLVYLSGDYIIRSLEPLNNSTVADKAAYKWNRAYNLGNDFLSGAESAFANGAYSLSLLCLQQATEFYLMGLLKGVLGHKINTHNLSKLLSIIEMFTTDIAQVFTGIDKELFDELKNAYTRVRYSESDPVGKDSVEKALPYVKTLREVSVAVYERHLQSSDI